MSLKAQDLDTAWAKLRFDIDRTSRDITATLRVNGKIVVRTRRSHGAGKLDGKVQHFVRQQMKLNENQFADAIACPLQAEDYLAILATKGLLPPSP